MKIQQLFFIFSISLFFLNNSTYEIIPITLAGKHLSKVRSDIPTVKKLVLNGATRATIHIANDENHLLKIKGDAAVVDLMSPLWKDEVLTFGSQDMYNKEACIKINLSLSLVPRMHICCNDNATAKIHGDFDILYVESDHAAKMRLCGAAKALWLTAKSGSSIHADKHFIAEEATVRSFNWSDVYIHAKQVYLEAHKLSTIVYRGNPVILQNDVFDDAKIYKK